MNKIDKIVRKLLNSGEVSIEEALAIGSAVRTLAKLPPLGETYRQHCHKYGNLSVEGAKSLLKPVNF